MSGGLIQLAAYGQQDIYINGNPQITFFKIIYRRHTNFSIESIEQVFATEADFGRIVSANITRGNGDLINRIYLQVTLPALKQYTELSGSNWVGYVNSIGHNLIKRVDLEIGGQLIERHYSEWLEIWSELTLSESKRRDFNEMIGKYDTDASLKTNALAERTYYIPLQFWFCRNPGLALPLIALTQHEVKIKIEFRPITELVKSNFVIPEIRTADGKIPTIGNCSLYIDYIYLDDQERKKFAQAPHEYLIEVVQYQGDKAITNQNLISSNDKIKFSFENPVKELLWVIQTDTNLAVNTVTGNNHLNFSSATGKDTFKTLRIQFNGGDRFSVRNAEYFRLVQSYEHHTGSSRKHIYSYSFAIKPEEHQPSGSVNMSRLNNSDIFITFDPTDLVPSQFKIFALSYNIMRIVSGTAGLAY
jgi:hypothetical protein